jgi:predicted nucleic acid-binding Zn ribbon protein
MPRYDCECQNEKCQRVFEVGVPLDDLAEFDNQENKEHRCPECEGKLKRLMGTPDFRIN